jgi:hypothetical protein
VHLISFTTTNFISYLTTVCIHFITNGSRDDGMNAAENEALGLTFVENSILIDEDNMAKNLDPITNISSMPPFHLTGMNIYADAMRELDRIREAHKTLAPTGCTPDFCLSVWKSSACQRASSWTRPTTGRNSARSSRLPPGVAGTSCDQER